MKVRADVTPQSRHPRGAATASGQRREVVNGTHSVGRAGGVAYGAAVDARAAVWGWGLDQRRRRGIRGGVGAVDAVGNADAAGRGDGGVVSPGHGEVLPA